MIKIDHVVSKSKPTYNGVMFNQGDVMSYTVEKQDMYSDHAAEHKYRSVWSIFSVDNLEDDSGLSGAYMIYSEYWGGKPISVALPKGNLTYAELYYYADQLIRDSGDTHHIFIESFEVVGDNLVLWTGS